MGYFIENKEDDNYRCEQFRKKSSYQDIYRAEQGRTVPLTRACHGTVLLTSRIKQDRVGKCRAGWNVVCYI